MKVGEQFKRRILDLAIRGKLVPQDPNDEPASELLARIKAEKEKLIKAGKIKKGKSSSVGSDGAAYEKLSDDAPFRLPKGWAWCKLEAISSLITDGEHKTPRRVNAFCGYYLLSARNIRDGYISLADVDYVDSTEFSRISPRCNPKSGDILISCSGSVGRCALVCDDNKYVMVRSAAMVSPMIVNSRYIMFTLQANIIQKQIQSKTKQTAQANLFQESIRNLGVPLPPLAEQKRIVTRIDELFKVADSLGAAVDGVEATSKWLDKKILDLAIRGKLVPQNPNDEPASELLMRIAATSHKSPCKNHEMPIKPPFGIPKGWAWCRIGDVCEIEMGQSPDGASINKMTGIEFHQGKIYFTDHLLARSNEKTIKPTKVAHGNSVLLCVRAPVGKVNTVDRQICIGRGLCAISPVCGMNVEFWFNWLKCLEGAFNKKATGSTFKAITKNTVVNQMIPLPPLAEQKRIVAKIEELRKVTQALTM